ncbi:hypothetical protein LguiA_033902 [Lonicera macranthoides]
MGRDPLWNIGIHLADMFLFCGEIFVVIRLARRVQCRVSLSYSISSRQQSLGGEISPSSTSDLRRWLSNDRSGWILGGGRGGDRFA